jgi:drug/metabolite transporter (DMT)-like permease
MSKFAAGNILLFASMICTTASHVMIKGLVDEVGGGGLGLGTIGELLESARIVRSMSAGLLLVLGFLFWVLCLSRLSLSYAYPVASTSVLLIAAFSVLTLGETITPKMWAGTVLILVGVVLLRPAG